MSLYALRMQRGQDLRKAINDFAASNNLSASVVVSAVGSLSTVVIRMAGAKPGKVDVRTYEGHFEIVSLIGTVQAGMHLHMAISDTEGRVIGGHVKDGCIVDTTVELVLADEPKLQFSRTLDQTTGFDELQITDRL